MEKDTSEKICENCEAKLEGPYCHACGQKHHEHKHSFFQLLVHFVGDFVHFDAQLFTTLKPLFTKPGLVAKDYVEGRRKRHLDPIRMYVFVSIVFFALFFSVSEVDKWNEPVKPAAKSAIEKEQSSSDSSEVQNDSLLTDTKLEKKVDTSVEVDSILNLVNEVRALDDSKVKVMTQKEAFQMLDDSVIQPIDTANVYKEFKRSLNDSSSVIKVNNWEVPKSRELYLAEQEALPKSDRDGWIKKNLILKVIHLNTSAQEDERGLWYKLLYQFVKSLPKLLFILLPFFALILKLLYVRRDIYYVDHLIFMIYFFCFLYIVYSISFLIQLTLNFSLTGIFYIWAFFYLYYAMRRFYGQSRLKTVAKFFLFGYISSIVALFGATIGALVSVLFI